MEFDEALSRWEEAQSAWARSELALSEAVYLYLARRAPAPTSMLVNAVLASRLSAEQSLAALCAVVRHSRESVPLL